jgi:hypothetical protein
MTCKLLALAALPVFVLAAIPAHATSVAVTGGDGAVGVQADTALLPALHANLGYLHTGDDRGSARIYQAGLMIAPPTPLLHWAVGARYQYQDTRYGSGGGVELGASLFVPTPIPLLSLGGYGFYMPGGSAHGRIRHSYDYGVQLRLGFTRSVHAYAGYRYLRTSFEGIGTRVLYKGPSLGLSVGF